MEWIYQIHIKLVIIETNETWLYENASFKCHKMMIQIQQANSWPHLTKPHLSTTAPVCPFEKGFVLTDDDQCVCPAERGFYVDENGNCQRCPIELGFILTEDGRCICDPEKGYVLTSGGNCDCPLPGVKDEDGICVGEYPHWGRRRFGWWKRFHGDSVKAWFSKTFKWKTRPELMHLYKTFFLQTQIHKFFMNLCAMMLCLIQFDGHGHPVWVLSEIHLPISWTMLSEDQ